MVRWTLERNYEQSLEDEPPTGTRMTTPGITVWQVADGQIIAGYTVDNQEALSQFEYEYIARVE